MIIKHSFNDIFQFEVGTLIIISGYGTLAGTTGKGTKTTGKFYLKNILKFFSVVVKYRFFFEDR